MSSVLRPSSSLRYAYPVRIVRADDHYNSRVATWRTRWGERGDFSERESTVEGIVAGGWQMADVWIDDMDESNVGKK